MDKKETPIKFLITSTMKSQPTQSLVNPIIKSSTLMNDILKNNGLKPKLSESSLSGSLSPLTYCFDYKSKAEKETQTETALMCDIESQTAISMNNKETQTEENTTDSQNKLLSNQTIASVEESTQTLETDQIESDLESFEQNSVFESSESLIKVCVNSSETEIKNSALSEVSKLRENIIEEISALEVLENQINRTENMISKTENFEKKGEIYLNPNEKPRDNSQNVRKYCCTVL